MLRKFNSDPYYLAKSCGISFCVFIILNALLLYLNIGVTFTTPWSILLIPLGMYLGVLSAVWIHNATHNSAGSKWINNVVGEICGAHQLHGWLGWRLTHLIHHKYPDNPEYDPHPPGKMGFWEFCWKMRGGIFKCLHNAYFRHWGDYQKFQRIERIKNSLGFIAVLSRVAFWYLLLGPVGFLYLYIPSYVTNYIFFGHLNWASHRPTAEGEAEILNLNHNGYYRTMNWLFCGMYFHKNHHDHPSVANPMKV